MGRASGTRLSVAGCQFSVFGFFCAADDPIFYTDTVAAPFSAPLRSAACQPRASMKHLAIISSVSGLDFRFRCGGQKEDRPGSQLAICIFDAEQSECIGQTVLLTEKGRRKLRQSQPGSKAQSSRTADSKRATMRAKSSSGNQSRSSRLADKGQPKVRPLLLRSLPPKLLEHSTNCVSDSRMVARHSQGASTVEEWQRDTTTRQANRSEIRS